MQGYVLATQKKYILNVFTVLKHLIHKELIDSWKQISEEDRFLPAHQNRLIGENTFYPTIISELESWPVSFRVTMLVRTGTERLTFTQSYSSLKAASVNWS